MPNDTGAVKAVIEGDFETVPINQWAVMIMGDYLALEQPATQRPNWLLTEWYGYLFPEGTILAGTALFFGRKDGGLTDWPTFLPLYWADI